MGLRLHLSLCACKTARLAPELLASMGPCPHLWFLHAKQGLLDQNYKSLLVSALICVFECKTAWFASQWQVYIGSIYQLRFWAHITACLAQGYQDHIGSPHLWFCAWKTVTLGLELKVSVGPRLHVRFLQAKQRLLDKNNKSLWVPDIPCRFVHAKQRDLHQNYKSLWDPDLTCSIVHSKLRDEHQNYMSVWVPDLICCFEHT